MTLRQTATKLFDSAGWARFAHFCPVFNCFLQSAVSSYRRLSGIYVRLIVSYKAVKFRDSGLPRSGEIRPKTVRDGIFGFFRNNWRQEVAGDVISGVVVE